MKDLSTFIQSAELYLQASNLMLSIASLQRQRQAFRRQLTNLMSSGSKSAYIDRFRDLEDEIFACSIQIEAAQLQAKRLVEQSRAIRLGNSSPIDGTTKYVRRPHLTR